MKYAGLIENDVLNGEGVSVSLWMQGCPHKCPGCHNPETWDENGGIEISLEDLEEQIFKAISANGIQRNFSVLGGEPFSNENIHYTTTIIKDVKEKFPNIIICVWTGYTFEEIQNWNAEQLLKNIDYLIEGRYIQKLRDITLKWRGSSNQRILKKGIDF